MKLTYAENEIVESVHEYITINFLESFSIGSLSKAYLISETKLTQGFRAKFAITIYGYYLERKMKYAKDELQKGATVSKVAAALNYSSTSSFIHAFRKVFPKPPGAYRYGAN
jgi:AraC-like DNA-binding protein